MRKKYVQQQIAKFVPALDKRVKELREQRNGKDAVQGTNLVYHTDNGNTSAGAIAKPLSAQVNAPSATGTPQGETDWAAAYRDQQKEAETKSAATLAQQSYWDMQKSAEAKSANDQSYAEAVYGGGKQNAPQPHAPQAPNEVDWTEEHAPQPQAEPKEPTQSTPRPHTVAEIAAGATPLTPEEVGIVNYLEEQAEEKEKELDVDEIAEQDVQRIKSELKEKPVVNMEKYYTELLKEIDKDADFIKSINWLLTDGKKLLIFKDWVKPGGKYDIKLRTEYTDTVGENFNENGVAFANDIWRSDAMGNIAAGYLAKRMGIPLEILSIGIGVNNRSSVAQDEYNEEYGYYPFFGDEPYDYYCYKYGYELG